MLYLNTWLKTGALFGLACAIAVGCGGDKATTAGGQGGTSTAGSDAGASGGQGGAGGSGNASAGGASGSTAMGGSGAVAGGGTGAVSGASGAAGAPQDAGTDASDASVDAPSDAPTDAPADAPNELVCGADQKVCGDQCVDIDDPAFGCGAGCDTCAIDPSATARCSAGACVFAGCATGFADCNADLVDFCETPIGSDAQNCGACGNVCVVNHGTASCVDSQCAVNTCDTGFGNCDGVGTNGCESPLDSDPDNCSACGTVCTAAPGGQAVCNAGSCSEKACLTFRGDRNNDSFDACEANLITDDANCGFCGNACSLPNAVATCSAAECAVESCVAPFEDCDGDAGNGCETDTTLDNSLHCGACGRACSLSNASSAVCSSGLCSAVCDFGFGNCEQPTLPTPDDGCELDVSSDPTNCGTCNNVCTLASATPGCAGGECVVADCTGTNADCDGDFSNGCEVDLATDTVHCGACNRGCANNGVVTLSCTAGVCDSICDAQSGNCSTPSAPDVDDGCESDVTQDPLNCGACSRRCGTDNVSSLECSNGACTSTCQLGFGNCLFPSTFSPDDGCETDVSADKNNCGGCGNDCTQQGAPAGSLLCGFVEPSQCGCVGNVGRCRVDSGTTPDCPLATGLCVCDGTSCSPGEACVAGGSGDECSCEGGPACATGESCCQSAAGCIDTETDPAHCGACSRACPAGFDCAAGGCACSGDTSCDGGSAGVCSAGLCACGGSPCAAGQRCLADGTCG